MKVFVEFCRFAIKFYKCYLFICIIMLSVKSSSAFSTYTNATCKEIKCGQNAVCIPQGVNSCSCMCPYNFKHSPGSGCFKPECRVNDDCRRDQWCNDGKCVPLCQGACGINARCKITGRVISCVCLEGYVGDPTVSCIKISSIDDPCCNIDCGPSSECRTLLGRPTCFCQNGFIRNVNGDCIHECEVDSQCDPNHYCNNYKCEPICKKCGIRAMCVGKVNDHQPLCICPESFKGDPFIKCEPECYSDEECPFEKPFCRNEVCTSPCQYACGAGAECQIIPNGATSCSCPPGTTGDALFRCDSIDDTDPCNPNPCGKGAICEVAYSGSSLCAVCNCPPGLKGDPNIECIPGNCNSNSDCFYNQACKNYNCVGVCDDSYVCGKFANCTIKEHRPICSCSEGYSGDPTMECYSVKVQPLYFPSISGTPLTTTYPPETSPAASTIAMLPETTTILPATTTTATTLTPNDGTALWNSIKNKTNEVVEKMCKNYRIKLACLHLCKMRKESNCSFVQTFNFKEKLNNTIQIIDETLNTIMKMSEVATTQPDNVTVVYALQGSNEPCCTDQQACCYSS